MELSHASKSFESFSPSIEDSDSPKKCDFNQIVLYIATPLEKERIIASHNAETPFEVLES